MELGVGKATDDVLGYSVTCTRTLTGCQRSNLSRAQRHASATSLGCSASLMAGSAVFVSNNAPTISNLVDYSQKVRTCLPNKQINPQHPVSVAQANLQAQALVFHKYAMLEMSGGYRWIAREKPDDVIRVMYKIFSSLGLFTESPSQHRKV